MTITKVRKDGPTNVVDGYWEIELDTAYEEYRQEVEQAGYKVLSKEQEEHDAEITYRGEERAGQIALRETAPRATRSGCTSPTARVDRAVSLSLQILLSGLAAGSVYGLLAVGHTLVYQLTGIVHFALGDLVGLGRVRGAAGHGRAAGR